MSDETRAKDPGTVWREQPEEKTAVNLEPIVNRRTEELSSSTRAEILMSIGAAVLFGAVVAWRFWPTPGRLQEIGYSAVLAWAAVSFYWFRRRIRRQEMPRPETTAATGLAYYRKELERRRDHLRNAWLWYGPLFLACMILIAVVMGKSFMGFGRLLSALPLVLLLVLWTGFSFLRRRGQAKELQREIDEIASLGTTGTDVKA